MCVAFWAPQQWLSFSQRSTAARGCAGGLQQHCKEGCVTITANANSPGGRLQVGPALLRATPLPLLPCIRKRSCEISALGSLGSGDQHGLTAVGSAKCCLKQVLLELQAEWTRCCLIDKQCLAQPCLLCSALTALNSSLFPGPKLVLAEESRARSWAKCRQLCCTQPPAVGALGLFAGVSMYFYITRDNTSNPKDLFAAGVL